jgi:ribosome-associated protein
MGRVALEKKASDVVILEVGHLTSVADYFIFCSGSSSRQTNAIADAIQDELKKVFKAQATVEGTSSGTWILLDYGDIIVHIFHEEIRAFYGIENMWRDAKQVPQSEFDSLPPQPSLPSRKRESAALIHKAS